MANVRRLLKRLRDSDPFVRFAAAEALANAEDPQTLGPLLEALEVAKRMSRTTGHLMEDKVIEKIAVALGRLGKPEAVPALTALLENGNLPIVTEAAAAGLSRIRKRQRLLSFAQAASQAVQRSEQIRVVPAASSDSGLAAAVARSVHGDAARITVVCPNARCGKSYSVPAAYAGKRVRCEQCHAAIEVPPTL